MRVICTAGHVDHGKSTLVQALTGTDPDRLAEEQRRGLTIELGFAWTDLPGVGDVAFVDLPGHERFVPTMLAGAGPVATALFVVAADEGWMPQSAEHLAILRLLDVRSGVVALTRTDLVDAETVAIATELVAEQLVGSGLADAPVVPVSAVTGEGMETLRHALATVLQATPQPPDIGRPRLWVDRSFSIRGAGTVVTGTLAGGAVTAGDALVVWPGDAPVRVRGMQSLGKAISRVEPGWRVALNLVGVDVQAVGRGSVLGLPQQWIHTDTLDVWCTPEGTPLRRRGAWRVHVGTAEVGAGLYPVAGVELAKPGPLRMQLDRPLPLAAGDRVVIRDAGQGRTVGGGVVLDPAPGPRVRGRAQREDAVQRLTALSSANTPSQRLQALVADHGELPTATALAMAGASSTVGADVEQVGEHLLDPARWRTLSTLVVQAVSGIHQRRAALAVVPRTEARRLAATLGASFVVVEGVIDRVVAEGRLEMAPGGLRVPGHEPRLTVAQQIARTALLQRLDIQGWEPDPLPAVADASEADEDLLGALVREGELVLIENGHRALSRATMSRAVKALSTLSQPFTAAQARDVLGTSRRWALPLLEALDEQGVTRREGDLRTLRG